MGKSRQEVTSKADRKFEKKVKFYAKVRDSISILDPTKKISKKRKSHSKQKTLKAYDLSSLSEFLPELKAARQPKPASEIKLNCKSRQKLILKEVERLKLVLNHEAFQSDPIGSIHKHLQSTQPPTDETPKKKVKKNGCKKVRRKKSPTAIQAVDI